MASEHELGIRFTSEGADKVEKQIEGIADQVDDLNKGEVEIDVTADTREAETRIERFEREVDGLTTDARELRVEFRSQQINKEIKKSLRELEKLEDPVDIEVATADLERAQKDLRDLEELAERKYEIQIDADPKRTAKRAAGDMQGLNETSQRGIGVLRGVTDELGETAAAGGVAGAAFVDAGEAIEIFGSKAGLAPESLAKVSGALGGLGLAVTAGSVAWGLFTKAQRKAKEESEALIKVQEDLADDKFAEAAETLAETYEGLFATAKGEGISYAQTLGYITGQSDDLGASMANIPGFPVAALEQVRQAFEDQGVALGENAKIVETLRFGLESTFGDKGPIGQLTSGADAFNDLSGSVDDFSGNVDDAATDVSNLSRKLRNLREDINFDQSVLRAELAFDRLVSSIDKDTGASRLDILDMKDAVIDFAEAAGDVPDSVTTEILADIDAGDYALADAKLARLAAARTATIKVDLIPGNFYGNSIGGNVPGNIARAGDEAAAFDLASPSAVASASPTLRLAGVGPRTVQNITVNVPNGLNLRNVSDTLSRWQRVNGGRL